MLWRRQWLAAALVFSIWTVPFVRADQPVVMKTALDDYIAKPDPAYKWELVDQKEVSGATIYIVDLTSQTWRTENDVDRTLWKHWLTIVKPAKVEHDTGFVMIGGGANGRPAPRDLNPQLLLMAKKTNSVVMELGQIPNQPLVFHNDGKKRTEDDLIAYCWIKFMDTGDPTWLPRLPMVKSVVRAMDAATELLASDKGGKVTLKHWVVAGGSKRGWTTWLTAAVDPRVVACIPIVIDLVNVRATMSNHYAAYGFWAPAVGNYVQHKVMERGETPEYLQLLRIVDPYWYRDRLRMPKYILNAAGDQFFTPDSSRFYYADLEGPKYLRYVPNGDHSLRDTDAYAGMMAFYDAILKKTPIPTMSWKMERDDVFAVRASAQPSNVTLWQANNPNARDFRKEKKIAYTSSPVKADADGAYRVKVDKPANGWTAYLVEMSFPGPDGTTFKFSSAVQVTPDTLPHSYEDYLKSIPKKAVAR